MKCSLLFFCDSYVPWNLHEPTQGKFNFNGIANLTQFLTLANNTGLLVIARLGPYVCGNWDMVSCLLQLVDCTI